jgi:hypothetical protein
VGLSIREKKNNRFKDLFQKMYLVTANQPYGNKTYVYHKNTE